MTHLTDLLAAVAHGVDPGPFALLRREGADELDLFTGPVDTVEELADLPLPAGPPGARTLALVPYRQITERGFACVDDGAPLECLQVREHQRITADRRPRRAARRTGAHHRRRRFDVSDDEYARTVQRVLSEEIGRGEGANFVIHRALHATVQGPPLAGRAGRAAPAAGRRDAARTGRSWCTPAPDAGRRQPGTPRQRRRRHWSMMNPISGTFRCPVASARPDGAAALPRRPEGDRRAVHGARRGAEDDGHRRRARRAGDRPVPEGDVAPGAHRVPARRARHPRRAGGAARDDVRPDRHRQPDRERLPGDRPARAPGPRLLRRACWRCSATTRPAGRHSTPRS